MSQPGSCCAGPALCCVLFGHSWLGTPQDQNHFWAGGVPSLVLSPDFQHTYEREEREYKSGSDQAPTVGLDVRPWVWRLTSRNPRSR